MKLEQWLEDNELTYKDFAEAVGVTLPSLWKLRHGGSTFMMRVIRRIEIETNGQVLLRDICGNLSEEKEKKNSPKKKKKNKKNNPTVTNIKARKYLS